MDAVTIYGGGEKLRASGGRGRGRTNYDIYSEYVQFHRTIRHQVSGNQLNLGAQRRGLCWRYILERSAWR